MYSKSWLTRIQEAEKSLLVQDGKRKVHYKFQDGKEMVEEYNLDTNVVTRRAWKICKKFGSQPQWDVEVGDPEPTFGQDMDTVGIKETSTAPFTSKRITKGALEWRIRNLPYSLETYNVSANVDESCITIKTTNKKFFKQIPVIDLQRIGVKLNEDNLDVSHKFNTLIISYKKPPELLLTEKLILEELNKAKSIKEGDVQCPQS